MTELAAERLFEPHTIASLLSQKPDGGVLSVYVDADPRADPGLQGAAIDIRNRLAELRRNLRPEGPAERVAALSGALQRLGPELERLTRARKRADAAACSSHRSLAAT